MKKLLLLCAVCLASTNAFATGSHTKKAHVTKNGTYVQAHRATNPNSTKRDNYSHKGNVNPHTGKKGTKR
jgi:hypothetical protein